MKIEFQDAGVEARLVITSTAFEYRKHNRAVNRVLSQMPKAYFVESGAFVLKTHIYGNAADLYQAYLFVQKEMKL